MKLRSALLAATVLAAPVAAKAEAISGLYIGAGAGANFLQQETVKSAAFPQAGIGPTNLTVPGLGSVKTKFNTGVVGVASVGYGLGNGLRIEIEGDYRTNKFNRIGAGSQSNGSINGFNRARGDEQKYGGMLNALYDFDPNVLGLGFFPAAITPYIGAGVGYVWAQDHNTSFTGNPGPVAGFPRGYNEILRTNAGKGSFAYQGIFGAAFPIEAVPGLAITAEYRFMGLGQDRTYHYQYFAPGVATRANIKFSDDYNHSVMVGVRYAFNAAPPPPPMAPPEAPRQEARTYLVFFDWDRADLTDRARQIIAEAAQATTRVQVTRIEVSGHTDSSGTARYNQGLSVRRAQNVASELVRLGVPRQAITVQGFGETRPLVQTAKGVREPQNRRVEIVLK